MFFGVGCSMGMTRILRGNTVMLSTPASMLPEALRFQDAKKQPKGNSRIFLPETARQPLHLSAMALTCRELIAMLGEYRDHTLDSIKRASAKAHLLNCDECTAYLQSYDQTIRLSRAAFHEAVDSAAVDLSETAIREILRLGVGVRSRASR
ncbi:MAG: anti-sigma factor [Candidatus Binatia bacterium]